MARLLRKVVALELEEQILNAGVVAAIIGIFLPWTGGEWLGGESVGYSGVGFLTSYLGLGILLLLGYTLAITVVPLFGGPVLVRRRRRDLLRLIATSQATVLTLGALSVLTKTTLEFVRMEVRFGVYVTLIGSLVATLYAYLRFQDQVRREPQEVFHHPADHALSAEDYEPESAAPPPPPPPPPAPEPEEHRLHL